MRVVLMLLMLFSASAFAEFFFKTLGVESAEVLTPSLVEIKLAESSGYAGGVLRFRLDNVQFEPSNKAPCGQVKSKECERLDLLLKQSNVEIYLNKFEHKTNEFKGDIFVNKQNLIHKMIREGWYKFDYKKTRNKVLILFQKEAMCKGKGIWARESSSLDAMCNI